jgi:hypothetical protein
MGGEECKLVDKRECLQIIERDGGSLWRARKKAHQISFKSSQSAKGVGRHTTKPEPITSEEENKRTRRVGFG